MSNLSPASRLTDPITSHLAEQRINKGARQSQNLVLKKLVSMYVGYTARELAELCKHLPKEMYLTHEQIHKRLASVAKKGDYYRKCEVTGIEAFTWYPKEDV